MKVKISYTVDIEKVKSIALTLIDEATQSLQNQHGLLSQMSSAYSQENMSTDAAKATIDSVRRALAHIDNSLLDAYSIILGHEKYETSQHQIESTPEPPPEPQPETEDLIAKSQKIMKDIEELKESDEL